MANWWTEQLNKTGAPPGFRPARLPLLLAVALLLIGGGLASAQVGGGFDLTWWTVDGGGVTGVSGGDYVLLSTAGQPDAAPPVSGGNYVIESGFWPSGFSPRKAFLPLVLKPGGLPDLVGSFTLNPPGPSFSAGQPVTIDVVVTNQGNAPAEAFWVDIYINPAAPPTVNQRWNDLCSLSPCYGLAWYVGNGLGRGQSVTLSSTNFPAGYSRWPGTFAPGTSNVYLYVDMWNPGVASGGVLESNEANNTASLGGLSVTGLPAASALETGDIAPRPAP